MLPPLAANAKVFPAPVSGQSLFLCRQTSWLSEAFCPLLVCRSLLFPVAQAPPTGLVWGSSSVAKDVVSLRARRGPASLLAVAEDLLRAVWPPD